MVEVKATKQGLDREVTVMVDLGDNLQDAVAKFGEEVVFSNFVAQTKIRAQAIVRDMMVKAKTDDEIAAAMVGWKPGVARDRVVDPTASFMAKFDSMTEEEKDAMLERLMEKAGKVA